MKTNISYLLLTLMILGYSANAFTISLTDSCTGGACPSLMAANGQTVYITNNDAPVATSCSQYSPFRLIADGDSDVTTGLSSGDYICTSSGTYYGESGVLEFNDNLAPSDTCPNVEPEQSDVFYPIQINNAAGDGAINVKLSFSTSTGNIDLPVFLPGNVDTSAAEYSQNSDWVGRVGLVDLHQCPESVDTDNTTPYIDNGSTKPIYLCTFDGSSTYTVASMTTLNECLSTDTTIWDVLGQQRTTTENVGTCSSGNGKGNYLYKDTNNAWQYACTDTTVPNNFNVQLTDSDAVCDTNTETDGCIEIVGTVGSTTVETIHAGSLYYESGVGATEGSIIGIQLTETPNDIVGDNGIYNLNLPLYEPSGTDLVRSTIHYAYVNLVTLYNSLEGEGTFSVATIDGISTTASTSRYIQLGNINYIINAQ